MVHTQIVLPGRVVIDNLMHLRRQVYYDYSTYCTSHTTAPQPLIVTRSSLTSIHSEVARWPTGSYRICRCRVPPHL